LSSKPFADYLQAAFFVLATLIFPVALFKNINY